MPMFPLIRGIAQRRTTRQDAAGFHRVLLAVLVVGKTFFPLYAAASSPSSPYPLKSASGYSEADPALAAEPGTPRVPGHPIEFPEAPTRHLNAICLPNDWHKPLVTQDGALAYDFGPGPYAQPLTEIGFVIEGVAAERVHQHYDDPRVPVPLSVIISGTDTLRTEAFTVIPPGDSLPMMGSGIDPVFRFAGLNGTGNWAVPPPGTDPAFRSVAWGTNHPIRYRVKLPIGAKRRVALGLCESYKPRPGGRFLSLQVEGASHRTVDPMADGTKNRPHVYLFDGEDSDGDGFLKIECHAAPESPDPNVILNCFWIFPSGSAVTADEILSGRARRRAELVWECGRETEKWAPLERMDVIRAAVSGTIPPQLRIRTRRSLECNLNSGMVVSDSIPYCRTFPPPSRYARSGDTLMLFWPAGTRSVEAIVFGGKVRRDFERSFPDVTSERERVVRYWMERALIPRGRMTVPDARLQYLIDVNTRNLYQVRDVVDGGIQFQPGPTVYRGLWLGDVCLSGTSALMLGDTQSVRLALEHGMGFQGASGQFLVLRPATALWETPIFLTMMCRYAAFAGNDAWLRTHWPVVRSGIQWIRHARNHNYDDEQAPYSGLMPPGFVDGGISHKSADYGTNWWVLIALEHAVAAAERLGFTRDAREWKELHSSFDAPLHRAILRDLKRDPHGLEYLPITIGDTTRGLSPQRGQYAFLLPIPYGRFFSSQDPVLERAVSGTLAMLDATTSKGMIVGSGWMPDGVWSWLGGIHSMAHHYRDSYDSAWSYLQAFADHATPLGTWVEEQQQKSVGTRTAGDASNAEASAIFLQTVRSFLLRERVDTLHLFAGFPSAWVFSGSHAQVIDGGSTLGGLSLDLRVSDGGDTLAIRVSGTKGRKPTAPVLLHLATFQNLGYVAMTGGKAPHRILALDTPAELTMIRGR